MNQVEIVDQFEWDNRKKVLTYDQMGISNLSTFGWLVHKKANAPLPYHFHKNKVEFHVIVEGLQRYEVEGGEFNVYGGQMFLNYADEPHGSGFSPQSNNEILWFQVDLSSKTNFLGISNPWGDVLFHQICSYRQRVTNISELNIKSLRTAFLLLNSDSHYDKLRGHNHFVYFLTEAINPSTLHSSKHGDLIKRSLEYIEDNIHNNIRIEDVCKCINLSESYFKSIFKNETGITPAKYISFRKVEKAKMLLETTNLSIIDIAMQLEFSSSQYFSTVFKKHTNHTPQDYRAVF